MKPRLNVESLGQAIRNCADFRTAGRLVSSQGLLTTTLPATTGELCQIFTETGQQILAEAIGFHNNHSRLMPLQSPGSLSTGAVVVGLNRRMMVPAGRRLTGRVLNALGQPVDNGGPLKVDAWIPLCSVAPNPLQRIAVAEQLETGQRAIDGLLPIGKGQRIGLFAGSGVGKSTLLGELAKQVHSDINIVVLVGERGREVRPFISDCLGPEGLQRSIVIVSTAEQPPLVRIRAAQTAITLADWFRSHGCHVVLMVDSLTRLAWAQRELGLLMGEPPSSRGFPPSAIQLLANLVEQLGTSDRGAITGILTVLVDGDDTSEPVTDAARSVLDGHIVLDRALAERGHFPAINISASVSRVINDLFDARQKKTALLAREILAEYLEVEDLIRIGAYQPGLSPRIDMAIQLKPVLDRFLRQAPGEFESVPRTLSQLAGIVSGFEHV